LVFLRQIPINEHYADTKQVIKMKKDEAVNKVIEAPAELLEKTIETTQQVNHALHGDKTGEKARNYWRALGPGLTTGASDDDPSGIATYSQTGAQYGFQLIWLSLFTFPLMAIVQEMCARIGLVTGRGLAGNIRVVFSHRALYLCAMLLFAANSFNIGADLGAMSKAVQLLFPAINFGVLVIGFTVVMLWLQIFTPYERYAKYLKWLSLILFAYVLSAFLAHLDWGTILKHTVIPSLSFNKDQLLLICAILGTTISPYLFFWQTSQEVEEQIVQGNTTIKMRRDATSHEEVHKMRVDVWSGMILSNVTMFFIIATCGALLFTHGITNIQTASQAAEALRPFGGSATFFLFAVGIIGVGMLAIPVLAGSSSYAVAESLNKQGSLGMKLKQAPTFYGVVILSMLVGLGINFIGLNPIKALIYSAVLNGMVAPVVLVFILLLSSSHKVMGEWVNGGWSKTIGWLTVLLMGVSGVAALFAIF
jgi:NRAMP (natural resistance-associated macrophage protein)-like metal ion transporter